MALEIFGNLWAATVTAGGTTAPAAGTQESWTVTTLTGSVPPASSSAFPATVFHVVENDETRQTEVARVINVSGSTWTVIRGADGTAPVAHPASFTVVQTLPAGVLGSLTKTGGIYLAAIIKSGAAAVGDDILKPGLRIPADCVLANCYAWCDTAPTGASLVIQVDRTTTGGVTTTIETLSILAGTKERTGTGSTSLLKGELITFNITAVGSTVPGSDVAVQLEAF